MPPVCHFIERETQTQSFFNESCKMFRTFILKNTREWLIPYLVDILSTAEWRGNIQARTPYILAFPANIYSLKVKDRNARNWCEICSKLVRKTSRQRQRHGFNVFIVNFEHISHFFLVFLLLSLSMYLFAGSSLYLGRFLPDKITFFQNEE